MERSVANHSGTYTDTKATVRRLAVELFADHALIKEGAREWRCGRKGTVVYSARILFRPGMIAVWGDLGEWILRHGDSDSIGWLRGAISSPDYLLSKVQAGEKERFYPDDALAWLRSEDAVHTYGRQKIEVARESLDLYEPFSLTIEQWLRACYEAEMDDPPRFEKPCESALWLVELLRKFVALEAAGDSAPRPGEGKEGERG